MQGSVLRTLVVDDEPIARHILREELAEVPGIQVIGDADNGRTATELIGSLRPDLVFLDVQMPAGDGFEVVRRLSALPPAIVFVTAYDQHALRAFEVGAADYLLKPIRQDRLRAAVERVRAAGAHGLERAESLAKTVDAATGLAGRRRIVGKKGEEYFLLDLEDVVAFRAEGELVWILTTQKRFLATQTLQQLTARLEGTAFRRIHRGALINLNHIRKLSSLSSQRWLVTMTNELELIVSKRQAHTIREVLHA